MLEFIILYLPCNPKQEKKDKEPIYLASKPFSFIIHHHLSLSLSLSIRKSVPGGF
jgi:hypothetical protein